MSILKNLVADAVDEVRSVISRNLGEPLTIGAESSDGPADQQSVSVVSNSRETPLDASPSGQGDDGED